MKRTFLSLFVFILSVPLFAQNKLPDDFNPNAPGQTNQGGARAVAPLPAPLPPVNANQVRTRYNAVARLINAGQAPADPQNTALLRFKMEQAIMLISQANKAPVYWVDDYYRAAQTAIERAELVARARGDAVFPAATQEHERAYISSADNSVQPYWVYVPKGYTPTKKYPMVVFLHGYSPQISKIAPWIPDEATWSLATNRGFIFVVPYGRRNTDFVGIGKDDTTVVTEAVKARYSVDPQRVFLMGASMGGYGVYAVGLQQPDLWAGLMPIAARSDLYLWFSLDPTKIPAWKRALYDANDPLHLVGNGANIPTFIQHGALDTINVVDHPRKFVTAAKAKGTPIRYREVADGDHYIYFDSETYSLPLDWAADITRQGTPPKVEYTTGDLRNHRAYWVSIEGMEKYGQSARITAEIKPGNRIEVQSQNVARFTLEPPAEHVKAGQALTLSVNGVEDARQFTVGQPLIWPAEAAANAAPVVAVAANIAAGAEGATVIPAVAPPVAAPPVVAPPVTVSPPAAVPVPQAAPLAFPGLKSPQRAGPVKNCYRDAFLVVYGTQQGVGDKMKATRFLEEWTIYSDGTPLMKADTQVTPADRKKYNLVLIGTRGTNSLLAGIADQLPLELLSNGYRVGDQKFTLEKPEQIGLQFCYPSPFDAQRMIVVQSGLTWGAYLPENHKFDLLPDYIVFDDAIELGAQRDFFDKTDQSNHALLAGFFDGRWQLVPPPGGKFVPAKPLPPEPPLADQFAAPAIIP